MINDKTKQIWDYIDDNSHKLSLVEWEECLKGSLLEGEATRYYSEEEAYLRNEIAELQKMLDKLMDEKEGKGVDSYLFESLRETLIDNKAPMKDFDEYFDRVHTYLKMKELDFK